jgi:hypothetical protein
MFSGRLAAQNLMVGLEYSSVTWAALNNKDVQGNGWGRGLAIQMSGLLKSSLEWGMGLSAGEFRDPVTGFGSQDIAPYGRLQGQMLWSPLKFIGGKENRYRLQLLGCYTANYVPAFSNIGFRRLHADVGVGLRQTIKTGKNTSLFTDVYHHQRLGADFKTLFCARLGLSFKP